MALRVGTSFFIIIQTIFLHLCSLFFRFSCTSAKRSSIMKAEPAAERRNWESGSSTNSTLSSRAVSKSIPLPCQATRSYFFQKKCKMGGCSVKKCKNRSSGGYSMYRFPRDPLRRKEWEFRVNRPNWHANNESKLCSVNISKPRDSFVDLFDFLVLFQVHFAADMFFTNQDGSRRLKYTALPTIFCQGRNQAPNHLSASQVQAEHSYNIGMPYCISY